MNVRILANPVVLAAVVSVLTAALLGACAGTKTIPPTVLELNIDAAAYLNPNIDEEAAPVALRIYELRASGTFTDSDFFALFDQDQAILGADLVAREELRFLPRESRTITKTLHPDTRYIGIVAAYRNIDEVSWRKAVPVQPESVNRYSVYLGEKELTVRP